MHQTIVYIRIYKISDDYLYKLSLDLPELCDELSDFLYVSTLDHIHNAPVQYRDFFEVYM